MKDVVSRRGRTLPRLMMAAALVLIPGVLTLAPSVLTLTPGVFNLSSGVLAAQAVPTGPTQAAELLESILAVDGTHDVIFPVRDGVEFCAGGGLSVSRSDGDGTWIRTGGRGGECRSDVGTARIRVQNGEVESLDLVGTGASADRATPAAPPELTRTLTGSIAAELLIAVAASSDRGRVGDDAVLGAAIARDAVIWPELLVIARDGALPQRTRTAAVFWVGQRAADRVTGDLAELAGADDEDVEVREAAVFALSQLADGVGRASLMEIARSDIHPRVRRSAFFWLADEAADDPEVLAFFEEVLTGQ